MSVEIEQESSVQEQAHPLGKSIDSSDRFNAFLQTLKTSRAEKQNFEVSLQEAPPVSYEGIMKRLSEKFIPSKAQPFADINETIALGNTPTPEDIQKVTTKTYPGTVQIGQPSLDTYRVIPIAPDATFGGKKEVEALDEGLEGETKLGGNAVNVAAAVEKLLGLNEQTKQVAGHEKDALYVPRERDSKALIITEAITKGGGITLHASDIDGQNAASLVIVSEETGEREIHSAKAKRTEAYRFNYEGDPPDSMYLTSISSPWKEAYRDVIEYAKAHPEVALAVSPGSAQFSGMEKKDLPAEERETMKKTLFDAISVANSLFVNKEEAIRLLVDAGKDVPEGMEKLLMAMKSLGPKVVSITDGPEGSYAIDGEDAIFFNKPYPVGEGKKVIDTTGAGDSYAATFNLYKRLTGDTKKAMECAAINASSVVQFRGAQDGLLTGDQIEAKRRAHPDYRAQMIKEPNPEKTIGIKRALPLSPRKNISIDEHLKKRQREEDLLEAREPVLV